jgi:hypothetical protein
MGIGFPRRLIRSHLGPKLRNNYPVENPASDVGDATLNGLFWNTAGLGLVGARWVVIAAWNGSQLVIQHQAEAWNPENDQAHPVLARTGTGTYTYTFASTYLDEDGVAVPTVIYAPNGCVNRTLSAASERTDLYAWIPVGTPLVVQARQWDDGGTARDEPFALAGW